MLVRLMVITQLNIVLMVGQIYTITIPDGNWSVTSLNDYTRTNEI